MTTTPSTKRFGAALFDLLRDHDEFTMQTGNVNLRAFAEQLEGFHYETLRKAVVGSRTPSRELIEAVARTLRVDPDYFGEYRLSHALQSVEQLRRQFDVREVGFEQALANYERWATEQAAAQPARTRRGQRRTA